jgi:hypothetical protein
MFLDAPSSANNFLNFFSKMRFLDPKNGPTSVNPFLPPGVFRSENRQKNALYDSITEIFRRRSGDFGVLCGIPIETCDFALFTLLDAQKTVKNGHFLTILGKFFPDFFFRGLFLAVFCPIFPKSPDRKIGPKTAI